jgi:hypothetical protein
MKLRQIESYMMLKVAHCISLIISQRILLGAKLQKLSENALLAINIESTYAKKKSKFNNRIAETTNTKYFP